MLIFSKKNHHHIKYLIGLLVILAALYALSYTFDFTPEEEPVFGLTFSKHHANFLGLNWKQTFIALLDDAEVRNFRIAAYWDDLEWPDDEFHFDDLDWQINEVRKRGGSVILAVGRRLPRWPECHAPEWARALPEQEQQAEILEMIPRVIDRYKNDPTIIRWQVENEPLLIFFGECPKADREFFKKEIALVREIDSRPIQVTASGEFDDWTDAGQYGDILGVSLYRVVWQRTFREVTYPLPPIFYAWRQWFTRETGVKKIILSELQTEPWSRRSPREDRLQEQFKSMNPKLFAENIRYARASGFHEMYLWGGEWWYWLRVQGKPEMWEQAKVLFHQYPSSPAQTN